jgi:hypothetical protein
VGRAGLGAALERPSVLVVDPHRAPHGRQATSREVKITKA